MNKVKYPVIDLMSYLERLPNPNLPEIDFETDGLHSNYDGTTILSIKKEGNKETGFYWVLDLSDSVESTIEWRKNHK